ncbi:hypothetical protein RHMOL_Rhmol06G0109300 [Rhododendron molle]|uniref:Uncharacterized protein n=1 Tax=Rhododendron molle TaxID=49168 RepID=A0ACC0NAW9_RHOML|nr:hypothetical protein RHMOL_Rhmol06G0109300 [Rhododendron molle]
MEFFSPSAPDWNLFSPPFITLHCHPPLTPSDALAFPVPLPSNLLHIRRLPMTRLTVRFRCAVVGAELFVHDWVAGVVDLCW